MILDKMTRALAQEYYDTYCNILRSRNRCVDFTFYRAFRALEFRVARFRIGVNRIPSGTIFISFYFYHLLLKPS